MPNDRAGGRAKRVPDSSVGPWHRWRGSRHGRAIRFIERYCAAPKGVGYGRPLKLAPWQKEEIEAILAPDVDAAMLSFPRGNGKSTLEAALAVEGLFVGDETGAPQVPIIATTVGQAIRSVYSVAAAMVAASPDLEQRSIPFTGWGSTRIEYPYLGGSMFPIANEIDGLQGLDPTRAIADEIGFQPMDAWAALLMAGGKRERSLALGMGTPGVEHENALYQTRAEVVEGHLLPRFHFREWHADYGCEVDDRAQWRKANPAIGSGFLRESALETDLAAMRRGPRFRIFRLGQWVEGTDGWLGDEGFTIWRDTEAPWIVPDGSPIWVGVDAAITRDTTAVVYVAVRDDVPHAVARFWTPTRGEPTDLGDVMGYLRELTDRFRVGGVAYDPRFMDWPAKLLHDEGVPMVEISQGVDRMTPLVGDLFGLFHDRAITHDRDPLFQRHVLSAVPRQNERGFTLAKSKSHGHIDGAIALALAVGQWRGKRRPRGLFVG